MASLVLIKIGLCSGNGLLPFGTKPFSGPIYPEGNANGSRFQSKKRKENDTAMKLQPYAKGQWVEGFYTPVWKTDVLCYGNVRPSVRLSEFSGLFSTCFEISIWNLVYAFSRWHDMSSLSFITIGSLWPSLQPKVGQTQFLQSWPYKSR